MRRCQWRAVLARKERMAARVRVTGEILAKNIGDGRQAVVRLIGRDMMNVRSPCEVRRLVGDVARQRVRVVSPCERLAERGRLNHSLVGELLVRRRDNAQARRRPALASQTGRLRGEMAAVFIAGSVAFGRLLL